MEKKIVSTFEEMEKEQMEKINGGGVVSVVSNFFANKIIWTNANVVYSRIHKPSQAYLKGKRYA